MKLYHAIRVVSDQIFDIEVHTFKTEEEAEAKALQLANKWHSSHECYMRHGAWGSWSDVVGDAADSHWGSDIRVETSEVQL